MPDAALPTLDELESARAVVARHMAPTPHIRWPLLASRTGAEVWVKHENHTPIGAFKIRGGLNYMNRLKSEQPDCPGVITATRGNHGQHDLLLLREISDFLDHQLNSSSSQFNRNRIVDSVS